MTKQTQSASDTPLGGTQTTTPWDFDVEHFDVEITRKAVSPYTEIGGDPVDFVDLNYCQNCGRVYETQEKLHEVWNGGIRFFLCDKCYERYLKSLPSTPPRYDRYSYNEFPSTPLWPHSPVDGSPVPYC